MHVKLNSFILMLCLLCVPAQASCTKEYKKVFNTLDEAVEYVKEQKGYEFFKIGYEIKFFRDEKEPHRYEAVLTFNCEETK